LRIVFALFLVIFLIALATGTGMAQENAEAAKAAKDAVTAEPYKVVDYRNFFGLDGRLIVWIISELHLMFAAFVLAVPIFVVIIEIIGAKGNDIRFDNLAREFTKLLSAAFATTASLGGLLAFALSGLYALYDGCFPSIHVHICALFLWRGILSLRILLLMGLTFQDA